MEPWLRVEEYFKKENLMSDDFQIPIRSEDCPQCKSALS